MNLTGRPTVDLESQSRYVRIRSAGQVLSSACHLRPLIGAFEAIPFRASYFCGELCQWPILVATKYFAELTFVALYQRVVLFSVL